MSRSLPRLPLDGNLDLTYRCDNTCHHCWLWLPPGAPEAHDELSYEEIRGVVDEARAMGTQAWALSGGEPMLRPDFPEIFDYITRKAVHYSLNTNGTLITPEIARLLARRGRKLVALYGATAEIHDRVTRNPGSFDAAMRGLAYLKEAGAGFIVQIIPMRENVHQYAGMVALAQTLSPNYRMGAPWLWLSACGSLARNREIAAQRLTPAEALALDPPSGLPSLADAVAVGEAQTFCGRVTAGDDRLFASCIAARRDFHIDPYGRISFCIFVKDPAMRYDLRRGSFREAWDEFIPSLAGKVRADAEYEANCGSCDKRAECRWCPVYAFLEHGRFTAPVEYLCAAAEESRSYKEEWRKEHVRYFRIGGMTVQLAADFPLTDDSFAPQFSGFGADGPGLDTISLRLSSPVASLSEFRVGREVYRKPPWAIYHQRGSWIYQGISTDPSDTSSHSLALFNEDHTKGTIWRPQTAPAGPLNALTMFPTDQILLARLLADRQGCIMHASGIIVDGKGLLFVGHSEAGKSTILKMLRPHGEILCDERIIVRRWPEGFRIHGTWSHGELPDVSPNDAPLHAAFFLEKADVNEAIPVTDTSQKLAGILGHVIRPLVTADWWEKTLDLAGKLAAEVPIYRLRFDKSGAVVDLLKKL